MTLNNLVVFAGPLAIWSLVAGSIIKEQQSNRLWEVGVYVLLQLTCAILYTFVVLPLLHSEYSYSIIMEFIYKFYLRESFAEILTSGIKFTGFGRIFRITFVSMSEGTFT